MDEKEAKPRYPVGFKKPPHHSQFKPGQSGNPRGRPKQKENKTAEEIFLKEWGTIVVLVSENGRKFKMTKGEYVMKELMTMAMKRDIKALKILLDMRERIGSKSGHGVDPFVEAFSMNFAQIEAAGIRQRDERPCEEGDSES
jgi:hypothetical protein